MYRTGIGPIADPTGTLLTEEKDMAGELNRYFSSVFTREDMTNIPDPPPMRTRSKLKNIFITSQKVRKKILGLKPHSAAGPDGIAPRFLQECVDQLAPVLAMNYSSRMPLFIYYISPRKHSYILSLQKKFFKLKFYLVNLIRVWAG